MPPGFELEYFQTGTSLTLFEIKSVQLALLICYESEFPESVRRVVEMGAELVVVPTAIVKQWRQVPFKVIPARAYENGVFMAYANHCGRQNNSQYLGASCIVDPSGHELARAGENEEVITATLNLKDIAAARSRVPFLADRSKIPGNSSVIP